MTTDQTDIRTVAQKAQSILTFLAGLPSGNATAPSRTVVREIMLVTGGSMMACGKHYDIIAKPLGGGVYRITLKEPVL